MGHAKCYKNVTTRLRRRQDPSANKAHACRPVQTGLVFFLLGAKSKEPRVNDPKCTFAGSSDYYVKRKPHCVRYPTWAHYVETIWLYRFHVWINLCRLAGCSQKSKAFQPKSSWHGTPFGG